MSVSERCELFWDYYGPASERTATHFHHHLIEWLKRAEAARDPEHLEHPFWPSETRVIEYDRHHCAVYCDVPRKNGEQAARALRAHRAYVKRDEVTGD